MGVTESGKFRKGGAWAGFHILRETEQTLRRTAGLFLRWLLLPWIVLASCAAAFAAGEAAGQDAPAQFKVIASIKPVHSLVAGVMEGAGSPILLVTGAASEHDYALLPSQAKALAMADLVFWVGPQLEVFLQRPLAPLAGRGRAVELSRSPGITLLPASDHEAASGDDMHIWLDPVNAIAMVQEISRNLQIHDPRNAAIYARNAAALQVRITALRNQLQQQLNHVRLPPYIVFHNAYQYFETRFGMKPVAAITLAPERPPGAARIRYLRRMMEEAGVKCVFMEPQFPQALAQTLVEGTPARAAQLDPLGAPFADGSELYFSVMTQLSTAYLDCAGAR